MSSDDHRGVVRESRVTDEHVTAAPDIAALFARDAEVRTFLEAARAARVEPASSRRWSGPG